MHVSLKRVACSLRSNVCKATIPFPSPNIRASLQYNKYTRRDVLNRTLSLA
jgi:hypothetical protein